MPEPPRLSVTPSDPGTSEPEPPRCCPFLGALAVPVVKQTLDPKRPKVETEVRLNPCQEEGCLFWRAERGCLIVAGLEAMLAAAERKA